MRRSFRRALRSLGSGPRWVVVDRDTGKPRIRISYPLKAQAEAMAGPGEIVVEMRATQRVGPFSEELEADPVDQVIPTG